MPYQPLTILLSRPHGGLEVPPELADRLAIDDTTIYNECDLWVAQLFDFGRTGVAETSPSPASPGVFATVDLPVARVLVDANRPPDDLDDPDGPIKTMTSYGEAIYRTPLSTAERLALRARYWQPFHDALEAAVRQHSPHCKLILDCHNIAQIGPSAYDDAGTPRPLICLANLGDQAGEAVSHDDPVSCSPALLREAGRLAEQHFAGLMLLELAEQPPRVVGLNVPFRGGYIVRRLRDLVPHLIPVIMIEVNRGLFVGHQHPRTPIAPPNEVFIRDLHSRLLQWTQALLALL